MRLGPLLFLIVPACSTGSGSSGPGGPVQSCRDVLSALASAYDRCGTAYDTAYAQQLAAIAGGNCSNVVGVRDTESLEKTCIPSLRTIACSELQVGNLDPSCQLQLQRSR